MAIGKYLKNEWFGCPYCSLAFSSEQEYDLHFGQEHSTRKQRPAHILEQHSYL